MDKQKYWDIFLKTKQQFNGMVWKKEFNFNDQNTKILYSATAGEKTAGANSVTEMYSEEAMKISGFEKVNVIQVTFKNNFSPEDETYIELTIEDVQNGERPYSHKVPLIHFQEEGLNKDHTGMFNFEVPLITPENKKVTLKAITKTGETRLKDLKINYLNLTY